MSIKTKVEAIRYRRTELQCRHRRELEEIDRRLAKVQDSCPHPREKYGLHGIWTCEDCGKNIKQKEPAAG